VSSLSVIGTVAQVALSRLGRRLIVLAALGLFLAALAEASMVRFLAGTVVGWVSVGAVFLAAWPPPTNWPRRSGALTSSPRSSWPATPA
jgi:hypothetical protein